MFVFRSILSAALAAAGLWLASCAVPGERQGVLDAAIAEEVAKGRRSGFPDLSEIRVPEGKPVPRADLLRALQTMEDEAETLRVLRSAAVRPPRTDAIEARGTALKREMDALRARIDAAPPIDRGPF